MNPDDGYPDQKIAEIERTLKEIEENKQNEEKFQAITEKYDRFINQADAARDAQQWSKAKIIISKLLTPSQMKAILRSK